jgi:hypothetical protein
LGPEEQQQAGSPWGPQNPQALNRYAYGLNNPVRWADPAGHDLVCPTCSPITPVEWALAAYDWAKGTWAAYQARIRSAQADIAAQAFREGYPIEVIGDYGTFILDPNKLLGRNLHNIDQIDSGRLKGYGRGITDLTGGDKGAREAFEALTGQKVVGDMVRWVDPKGDFEILFRSAAKSGSNVPTLEVIHHAERFLEKIKFHP